MSKKIQIKQTEVRFLITDGEHTISVIQYPDGKLSIFRQQYFNEGFDFEKSDPKTIKAVCKLIEEALKLE